MSDLRTAAQQALEAMEFLSLDFFMLDPISPGREAGNKAITALRAALEQPNADYERGFVDGMSEQAKRSVDRAVNRMADALAEPVQEPGCDRCRSPLWCGTKCSNCGKV